MTRFFLVVILILSITGAYAQPIVVHGFVMDANSREVLIGATVQDMLSGRGTATNSQGFYSLTLQHSDTARLSFSYLGYKSLNTTFAPTQKIRYDALLEPGVQIDEVVVAGKRGEPSFSSLSLASIPAEQIKGMPSLMGNTDVLRAYQLLPGVQSGKEGTSGIYVRGGGADQNLFLLDGVPLFSVNHIGGFISTFDPEAINSTKVYKGGFPARYGGRLSSVVDIRMKRGGMGSRRTEVHVGTLSSKLSIDSPIKPDTSSLFLSIRRCNVDILTRIASLLDSEGKSMAGYTFYDLYGTTNVKISDKDNIYFSLFHGSDRIFLSYREKLIDSTEYYHRGRYNQRWGNSLLAVRYNRILNQKLFGNFTIAYTGYRSSTDMNTKSGGEETGISLGSGVYDIMSSANLDYNISYRHNLLLGVEGLFHTFNLGTSEQVGSDKGGGYPHKSMMRTIETKAYIEDRILVAERIHLNLGVHFGGYISYDQSESFSIQPRAFINYSINRWLNVNAGYAKMWQSLHLLTLSSNAFPTDFWIPSSSLLPPQKGNIITLGVESNVHRKSGASLSFEVFHKTMSNLIEVKEGVALFSSTETWIQNVETNGEGRVYGAEVLLIKSAGNLSGWVGYTWSKNTHQFNGINQGRPYPFRYHRMHDLSVVAFYKLSSSISLSGTWVYSSGEPITFAQQHYYAMATDYSSEPVLTTAHLYGGKNSYRLPAYHRLDLAANFSKKKPKGTRTWSVGLYNAYSKRNPFFLYYNYNQDQGKYKLYQFSLFPLLPSVSYSFVFE